MMGASPVPDGGVSAMQPGGWVAAPFVEDGGMDACLDLSFLADEFVLHADDAECGRLERY